MLGKRVSFGSELFDEGPLGLSPLKKGRPEDALLGVPIGPSDQCRASPMRAKRAQSPEQLRAAGSRVTKRERWSGPHPMVESSVASRKRAHEDEMEAGDSDEERKSIFEPRLQWKASRVSCDGDAGDGRFTLAQVRQIVEGAVREREQELREEYDAILLDRLDEQWRTFAKYNEDNVNQKLKESSHDYFC